MNSMPSTHLPCNNEPLSCCRKRTLGTKKLTLTPKNRPSTPSLPHNTLRLDATTPQHAHHPQKIATQSRKLAGRHLGLLIFANDQGMREIPITPPSPPLPRCTAHTIIERVYHAEEAFPEASALLSRTHLHHQPPPTTTAFKMSKHR